LLFILNFVSAKVILLFFNRVNFQNYHFPEISFYLPYSHFVIFCTSYFSFLPQNHSHHHRSTTTPPSSIHHHPTITGEKGCRFLHSTSHFIFFHRTTPTPTITDKSFISTSHFIFFHRTTPPPSIPPPTPFLIEHLC
ncbi:hypothetical protein C5167_006105, partial [Papaver somniferum]